MIICELGMQKRRSQNIIAMSRAYCWKAWRHADELPGVGKYGADAYALFVTGKECERVSTPPTDHALLLYKSFVERETEQECLQTTHAPHNHVGVAVKLKGAEGVF